MQLLKRIISAPALYLSWVAFVLLALVTGYFTDPYVFGFAALILAWISGAIVVIGVFALFALRPLSRLARATILFSLGINVAAIVFALRTLQSFKWA